MNESREILALRKDLLVARAKLQRLKVARHAGELRESLNWRNVATTLATSPSRALVFGLLLLVAGRGRMASLVRVGTGVVALARMFRRT